jgi:hypothetical protein
MIKNKSKKRGFSPPLKVASAPKINEIEQTAVKSKI